MAEYVLCLSREETSEQRDYPTLKSAMSAGLRALASGDRDCAQVLIRGPGTSDLTLVATRNEGGERWWFEPAYRERFVAVAMGEVRSLHAIEFDILLHREAIMRLRSELSASLTALGAFEAEKVLFLSAPPPQSFADRVAEYRRRQEEQGRSA